MEFLNRYQLALTLFLFCISVGLLVLVVKSEVKTPTQPHTNPQVVTQLKTQLAQSVRQDDPRTAFTVLRNELQQHPGLTGSCHVLVHEIGHAAYLKYHDFGKTMEFRDDLCNSGYIHGVIETYFTTAKNLPEIMQTICSPYAQGTFIRWQCDHGLGHGLMFATNNDLPKSLALCQKQENVSSQRQCISGVFMENVMADQQDHVTKYLKNDDLFYPCQTLDKTYKSYCYGYSAANYLKHHPQEYAKSLKWCLSAESGYETSCAQGMGRWAITEQISTPKLILSTCMHGDSRLVDACLQGMLYEYINHFGSLKEANELCKTFPKAKKALCVDTVAQKTSLFMK